MGRYRTLLPTDEFHRVRATEPAAGGGDVHPPRLSRLLPSRAFVSQTSWCDTAACAGAGAAQGVGLRREDRLCIPLRYKMFTAAPENIVSLVNTVGI